MEKEELIIRIKKLLALSSSSNANEAAVALSRAQKLIEKYQIDMSEIELSDIGELKLDLPRGFKNNEQSRGIATIINRVFGVEPLIMISGTSVDAIVFIGPKELLESCEYVFYILIRSMSKAKDEYSKKIDAKIIDILLNSKSIIDAMSEDDPQIITVLDLLKMKFPVRTDTDECLNSCRLCLRLIKDLRPEYTGLLNKLRKNLLDSFCYGYWSSIFEKVEEFKNTSNVAKSIQNYSMKKYANKKSSQSRQKKYLSDAYESGVTEGNKVTLRTAVRGSRQDSIEYKE